MWRQHATFCVVCRNHQVMQCSQHNTVILYYVPASGLERYTATTTNNNKQIFGFVSFESFHQHAPMSHLIFLKNASKLSVTIIESKPPNHGGGNIETFTYHHVGTDRRMYVRTKNSSSCCLKKNQNAPRPSEHPQSGGKNVVVSRIQRIGC